MRIFVHHHSFAYLNHSTVSARIVFRFIGHSLHIVLCERMGRLLQTQYAIPDSSLFVLSNAVFLPTSNLEVGGHKKDLVESDPLIVGFLGNITSDKGIFDFFEVLAGTEVAGANVRGLIAGPVHASIQQRFDSALSDAHLVDYVGPVYDVQKEKFLQSIDVLLFPSRYANEAEPVTILEALSRNAYVLSTDRGCCGALIDNESAGMIIPELEFVETARMALQRSADLKAYIASRGPLEQFLRIRRANESNLNVLLNRIAQ